MQIISFKIMLLLNLQKKGINLKIINLYNFSLTESTQLRLPIKQINLKSRCMVKRSTKVLNCTQANHIKGTNQVN